MDQIIFLIFGIIVTAAFFWLKNKNIQKNIGEDDKIKENLLNQLKSEFPESFNSLIGNETSYELIEKINQNRKKIIENELNQAKRELAAEKAAMDQININNKFLNDQIEIKEKTINLIKKNGFYEYYSFKTGEAYGASNFSWTASLFLDLILEKNTSLGID